MFIKCRVVYVMKERTKLFHGAVGRDIMHCQIMGRVVSDAPNIQPVNLVHGARIHVNAMQTIIWIMARVLRVLMVQPVMLAPLGCQHVNVLWERIDMTVAVKNARH